MKTNKPNEIADVILFAFVGVGVIFGRMKDEFIITNLGIKKN